MEASRRPRVKQLVREPLVHFLALGAALFLVARWRGASAEASGGRIEVSAGRIEALAGGFARTWQRPPTRAELEGLVEDWVREEVLYREALARGLDRDDTIVRRRLRQKLEFLADDLAELVEPSDEQLEQWLAEHADDYRLEPRLALRQVFVSIDQRGAAAESDARELLERLRAAGPDVDVAELGDPLLLPSALELQPLDALDRTFGGDFAARAAELPTGTWHGPLRSGYGWHLVLVSAREPGRLGAFEELRTVLARDWLSARRAELSEEFYRTLRARHEVEIQWPEPGP